METNKKETTILEDSNKKGTINKKKLWYIGVAGVLAITTIAGTIYFNMNKDQLQISKDVFTVELGDEVSLKPSTYLKEDSKKDIKNDTVLSTNLMSNEKYAVNKDKQTVTTKDKEYLEVGKYDFTMKYKKETKDFIVEVKDTKAPTFKDILKEIVVEQDAEDVDYTKYFKADDLSEAEITVDSEKVDLAKQGDYEIKVTATDKYKNEDTQTIKIKVVALEEAEKEGTITKTLDDTVYQSKAMKDKIAEAKRVEEEKAQAEQSNTNVEVNAPASNGNSGSTNTGGSTGGGSSAPSNPAPANPNVCVPNGQFGSLGNSGKVFMSKAEADAFGKNYILGQVDWVYSGYYAWTVYDNCGERNDVWTVDFY